MIIPNIPKSLQLKLQGSPWNSFPSLGVIDEILNLHPDIVDLVSPEIEAGLKKNGLGRGDSPSSEEILRCAIYKELRGVNYRELALHLIDSRICEEFTGLSGSRVLKKSALQEYISKISAPNLRLVMVALNKVAIDWGLEDFSAVRGDTTIIKTNIHYPTNASLVWDSIRVSIRLLNRIDKRLNGGIKKKTTSNCKPKPKSGITKLM